MGRSLGWVFGSATFLVGWARSQTEVGSGPPLALTSSDLSAPRRRSDLALETAPEGGPTGVTGLPTVADREGKTEPASETIFTTQLADWQLTARVAQGLALFWLQLLAAAWEDDSG